ncbi:MAG: hypothetical protein KDC42_11600 [Ignavibacteriae bacterium]|nr:hypothetical protein [Ignavibacteriota bacterium]
MVVDKKICGYCQSPIKNEAETVVCPGCGTPYHKDCWKENKGCAVYGCNEKAVYMQESSVGDMYVNIEYLINERRFADAITEAKRIIESDGDSIKAKRYYNKAVSLINTKIKLLNEAENAFTKGDYRSAEIYYSNAVQFLDDEERKMNDARIAAVREKVPQEIKRRKINNFITGFVVVLILVAIAYAAYYFVVLKEDRDFAEIERKDNTEDVKEMEMQLSAYQRFAMKYRDGRNYDKAMDKVSYFSGILADSLASSDWRGAMRYLKKIDKDRSAKTYSDVYRKIYSSASSEFSENVSTAKKLNSMKKYIEAKNMMEQALDIIKEFPDSKIAEQREKLNSNIMILSDKAASMMKYENIQVEIQEKLDELKKYGGEADTKSDATTVLNITIEEKLNNSTFLAKSSEKGSLLAVKAGDFGFKVGEFVSIDATKTGTVDIETPDGKEMTIPLYTPVKEELGLTNISPDRYERESILQRLEYLKSQRSRLDSILSVKLL